MLAGGADVQGDSDQFRFAYTQMTGDFDLKVRVDSLSAAGCLEQGRHHGRAHARRQFGQRLCALVADEISPDAIASTTGGETTAVGAGTPSFPNDWLRLKRVGNTYTGYSSTDGVNWTVLSSVTFEPGNDDLRRPGGDEPQYGETTTAAFRDLA